MAEGFNTDDMLDMYLFENTQLLDNLQEIVLDQKDEERFDEDAINEIFRTMHTIKGSSAIMMFDNITVVAHRLEGRLVGSEDGRSPSEQLCAAPPYAGFPPLIRKVTIRIGLRLAATNLAPCYVLRRRPSPVVHCRPLSGSKNRMIDCFDTRCA